MHPTATSNVLRIQPTGGELASGQGGEMYPGGMLGVPIEPPRFMGMKNNRVHRRSASPMDYVGLNPGPSIMAPSPIKYEPYYSKSKKLSMAMQDHNKSFIDTAKSVLGQAGRNATPLRNAGSSPLAVLISYSKNSQRYSR